MFAGCRQHKPQLVPWPGPPQFRLTASILIAIRARIRTFTVQPKYSNRDILLELLSNSPRPMLRVFCRYIFSDFQLSPQRRHMMADCICAIFRGERRGRASTPNLTRRSVGGATAAKEMESSSPVPLVQLRSPDDDDETGTFDRQAPMAIWCSFIYMVGTASCLPSVQVVLYCPSPCHITACHSIIITDSSLDCFLEYISLVSLSIPINSTHRCSDAFATRIHTNQVIQTHLHHEDDISSIITGSLDAEQ